MWKKITKGIGSFLTGGGSDLLSLGLGLFSDKRNRGINNRYLQQAQGQFDAQMDTTIQRRVADAKKAGIHPLFALGASAGASPTLSAGPRATNQGARAAQVASANAVARAEIRRLNAASKLDETKATVIGSSAATEAQARQSQGRDGIDPAAYDVLPVEVKAKKRAGVLAGPPKALVQQVETPDGRVVELYDPDLGLDEIGQFKYLYERGIHYATDLLTAYGQFLTDLGLTSRQVKRKMAEQRKFQKRAKRGKRTFKPVP